MKSSAKKGGINDNHRLNVNILSKVSKNQRKEVKMSNKNAQQWNHAIEACEAVSKSKWLKIEDKEEVDLILCGAPYIFRFHWYDGKKHPCSGDDCEICKKGDKSNVRFAIDVLKVLSSGYEVYFLEGSKSLLLRIAENFKEYGDSRVFKIRRMGSGTNTEYSVFPKDSLTEEQMNEAAEYELFDLKKTYEEMGYQEYIA